SFLRILCSHLSCSTDTAPSGIATLSLHDALPISARRRHPVPVDHPPAADRRDRRYPVRRDHGRGGRVPGGGPAVAPRRGGPGAADRKSTRLNSSHVKISYAVFCLKKKRCKPPRNV